MQCAWSDHQPCGREQRAQPSRYVWELVGLSDDPGETGEEGEPKMSFLFLAQATYDLSSYGEGKLRRGRQLVL